MRVRAYLDDPDSLEELADDFCALVLLAHDLLPEQEELGPDFRVHEGHYDKDYGREKAYPPDFDDDQRHGHQNGCGRGEQEPAHLADRKNGHRVDREQVHDFALVEEFLGRGGQPQDLREHGGPNDVHGLHGHEVDHMQRVLVHVDPDKEADEHDSHVDVPLVRLHAIVVHVVDNLLEHQRTHKLIHPHTRRHASRGLLAKGWPRRETRRVAPAASPARRLPSSPPSNACSRGPDGGAERAWSTTSCPIDVSDR